MGSLTTVVSRSDDPIENQISLGLTGVETMKIKEVHHNKKVQNDQSTTTDRAYIIQLSKDDSTIHIAIIT